MFDEYFKHLSSVVSTAVSAATLPPQDTACGASSSTTIDQYSPSPTTSRTTETKTTPNQSTNIEETNNEDEDAKFDSDTFINLFAPPITSSTKSSSRIGFAAALAVLITGASQSRQHGRSESIPPILAGSWEQIPNDDIK
ncbi:hypothetical protein Tco_1113867 [Tanacetum coccineum]|uniref:Uncharacterized protein n=1 Tax=Tanacetum coccineum TaxID=301880 RepID=A0ABQ5ITN5_9ASTR